MIESWAKRAGRATEQGALVQEITEWYDSERAPYTTEGLADFMEGFADLMTTVALSSSLEGFIEDWSPYSYQMRAAMASAIVAQEDVEFAAVRALVRARSQDDHTDWGRFLSHYTGAGWANYQSLSSFEEHDVLSVVSSVNFIGKLPMYTASVLATIVSTSFNDLMIDVDALDDLLGIPGATRAERKCIVADLCRSKRQRGADLVPTELLCLLEVISTESGIQQVVCAFLFFPAVVTTGISGIGRFVRFNTSPGVEEVLPLRFCSLVIPMPADEAKVWIDVPSSKEDDGNGDAGEGNDVDDDDDDDDLGEDDDADDDDDAATRLQLLEAESQVLELEAELKTLKTQSETKELELTTLKTRLALLEAVGRNDDADNERARDDVGDDDGNNEEMRADSSLRKVVLLNSKRKADSADVDSESVENGSFSPPSI